jgi:NAD(P)-dependent dehydrogenase (short-subunit alcohol dehydrogenase family)
MKKQSKKRIIITGCGYKPLKHTFYDKTTREPSHNSIYVDGVDMKLNIGAAIAYVLASQGATVHMISTTEEKLKNIKKDIIKKTGCNAKNVEYSVVNMLDEKSVSSFVESLPKDKTLHWVQSIGLGAGAYKVKDGNPYLPLEDISTELLEKESSVVLKGTHIMVQKLLPVFKKQKETRIIIISSMSAIRSYARGGTHCAAKGAIGRYSNAAMLELWKDNIYVTEMRPGGVDTGGYDNQIVQESILKIDKSYGGEWDKGEIRLAQPIAVANAVALVFNTPGGHITSINLVGKGQIPHEGS